LVLVTGPTGSGKTTTLYTALNEINQPSTKIITAEDPVEYQLPRINQVQVHEKIGLTFPVILRTALRQDPDVILIGEMRDKETVNIGLRAAMTGHLVFSTLHTNDAISTVSRLLDMDAEGFVVASSLQAVLAQRLIRRLCPECSIPHIPTEQDKALIQKIMGEPPLPMTFHQHQGCNQCHDTGYKGRIGVYELLVMTPILLSCLQQNDNTAFVKNAKQQANFKSLTQHALELAMQGITSLDEVMRIASDIEVIPETDIDIASD
jgi:MSHA biogenesis protein MshE